MEDNFTEFASIFWEYIKEGGYKCGWKNEQNMHFYRFTEGKFGYPTMIELFSRKPGYLLEIEEGIIPIHIDDDTSSLSAILLNDDYYKFMMSGRRVVDGIGVLGAEHLISFKMYANITPHICRHTYCSNMAKSGMNPKTLQYLMGHSDIGVTLNTYTHLCLEDAEDELKRLEDLQNARKELERTQGEKPVSQRVFKAI